MDPSRNEKTRKRKSRRALIIATAMLSVGAFVWFFWFQTLMLIQMHYSYRDIPIASMRPAELSDHRVTPGSGTKLSAFGYSFEVPWQDVDTDNVKRKAM